MATPNQGFWQMLVGFIVVLPNTVTADVPGETATYAADRAEGTGEEGPWKKTFQLACSQKKMSKRLLGLLSPEAKYPRICIFAC